MVVYVLLDLKRRGIGVRSLVDGLETCVIKLLSHEGILGHRKTGAPGVYVHERKVAALGLRVRRNRSYHGLALNVDMDLTPFLNIDPCGYRDLEVTQLRDLGCGLSIEQCQNRWVSLFCKQFNYVPSLVAHTVLPG
jgi:lipoyl(octanoyl) transferase